MVVFRTVGLGGDVFPLEGKSRDEVSLLGYEVLSAVFLLVMSDLWRGCFPSREGIKGCVTVRCAGWVEVFLLLLGEEVSVSFGWLL